MVLWRVGIVSGPVAPPIVVGAVLFPASRVPSIEVLAITADLVLVLGFAVLRASLVTKLGRGAERDAVRTSP